MKTKIYLAISIVIQIILAIYSIVMANTIVESQIAELQEMAEVLSVDMQELLEFAMTTKELIVLSSINIILNIIAGVIILKNNVVKRKGSLITIYIICLLTTPSSLASWICILNLIIIGSIKREKQKFNMKEAEETLKVELNSMPKKKVALIIVLTAAYLLQLLPSSFIPDSKVFMIIYVVATYLILFALAIITFFKEIKQGLKKIIPNFKVYTKYILRVFGIMIIFYLIANVITIFVTNKATSVNQETIEMLPELITIPLAVIWAPVVEEALFRGVIRKVIKNDTLFIIISSSIFGLLHAISEASFGIAIATAIPYAILGSAFAYIYAKTNNLTCSMLAHGMYNTLGAIMILLS